MDARDAIGALETIRQKADLLYDNDEVEAALDRMAVSASALLADTNPLIVCVLLGGLVPTARLMSRLQFPCELSYVHTTRYRNGEDGELLWAVTPYGDVAGRTILVVDDILHRGTTLSAIERALRAAGAAAVHKAVLVQKHLADGEPSTRADFVGLDVPDRYIFGYGMSYRGYWRNLTGVYAVG